MDTKSLILKTALELYNSQGVNAVTSRHIAADMGISAGNLHYHFKHTDDIIQALYDRLSTEFDALISELGSLSPLTLETFVGYSVRSFELGYKYRFIFLHFVEISLRIPAIRKHYHALVQRREREFLAIFQQLQDGGVFRKDIPKRVLEGLVTQLFIVADFWQSNNELTLRLKGAKAVKHYSAIFADMFYPYLEQH